MHSPTRLVERTLLAPRGRMVGMELLADRDSRVTSDDSSDGDSSDDDDDDDDDDDGSVARSTSSSAVAPGASGTVRVRVSLSGGRGVAADVAPAADAAFPATAASIADAHAADFTAACLAFSSSSSA